MRINSSMKEVQELMEFFPISKIEDWPEETCLTIGVFVDVECPNFKIKKIKKELSKSLGVDENTVDVCDGGTGKTFVFSEIMVNRGEDIHAADWILNLQKKVEADFSGVDAVCGVILD